MAWASSQGLIISPRTKVRRERLLPIEGQVLVEPGQVVNMGDVVARADLPATPIPIRAAALLGIAPKELTSAMKVTPGEEVKKGQTLAETRSFFGLFGNQVTSPISGRVDTISKVTGQVMLLPQPKPLEVRAYLPGRITEIIPGFGVEIEADVALLQGIFGLGGETGGRLVNVTGTHTDILDANTIGEEHRGTIVWGGARVTLSALKRMQHVGVRAAIAASASGADLFELKGQSLNPASTGSENIGLCLVLTEGFGDLEMAGQTIKLLDKLDGVEVSLNGTTQVRVGVQRPEVISGACSDLSFGTVDKKQVEIGTTVRIIRGKAFGKTGRIGAVPESPRQIGSGATALVFEITLDDQSTIVVPRPNVELVSP